MNSITVLNSCQLPIYFSIIYSTKSNPINKKNSSEFKTGNSSIISIPDDAYAILVRIFYNPSMSNWKELTSQNFVYPTTKCFEVFGPSNKLSFHEINCNELSGLSYVYIFNKSDEIIKGTLIYTVGKIGYKDESLELKNNRGRTFQIPIHANAVIFTGFVLYSYKGDSLLWKPIFAINILKRPYKKCYNITGTKDSMKFSEFSCPKLSLLI